MAEFENIGVLEIPVIKKEELVRFKKYGRKVTLYKTPSYGISGLNTSVKLKEIVKNSDALIVGLTDLNGIPLGENLRYIGAYTSGYENIPITANREDDIVVTNIPGYATEAVAELVFGYFEIFDIIQFCNGESFEKYRSIKENQESIFNNTFKFGGISIGRELGHIPILSKNKIKDKKIGIVGMGNIGKNISKKIKKIGGDIFYFSRTKRKGYGKFVSDKDDFFDLDLDIISLHVPLTKETGGFITSDDIRKMKEGTVLINTSRSEVMDENAYKYILREVKEGNLCLADDVIVLSKYPFNPFNYLTLPKRNLIITPHIGFNTQESSKRRTEILFSNIEGYLKSKVKNKVN